ncbi:hypothetical protein GPECTOR_825g55 [Gonium pectorale]|uniref:Integrase catalytic domain-containing protein n=1 Tax=Gonium pectorale TaxID=33097 RepID=A0A150FU15_GONPE|nr:hypothetical protein GPECTOR_825g55 [Gonium pectorale]|eukprot:KXZ41086.1 hypothetical protein GPECTOR_825g55 [Gonium pectorale]
MATTVNAYMSNTTIYGLLLGTGFLLPIQADLGYPTSRLEYNNDSDSCSSIAVSVMHQEAPTLTAEVREAPAPETDSEDSDPEAYLRMDEVETDPRKQAVASTPLAARVSNPETQDISYLEVRKGQAGVSGFAGAGPTEEATQSTAPMESEDSDSMRLETSEEMPSLLSDSEDDNEEEWGWRDDTDDQDPESEGSIDPWALYETYTTLKLEPSETLSDAAASLRQARDMGAYLRGQVMGRSLSEHLEVARVNGEHARSERDMVPGAGPHEELRALLLGKVNPELGEAERLAITGCLLANHDLFARSNEELGRTPWAAMKVDTGNAPPVFTPPYRMSKVERDAVDKEIQRMLADDIIEPSTSAWSSPVVVVPKRDTGELRFCVDMRRINEVTQTVRYPLGHIQDILDNVAPPAGQTRYYSSLDLKSGFWQVPMADEASKDRVSFHTASSQWRYKVMPMGLKNSPAVFAELMRRVLAPVLPGSVPTDPDEEEGLPQPEACAMVYLDDILIFSPDIVSHVTHLQQVFDLLRLASLKAAVKKCEFGQQRIHFLGHVLDGVNGTLAPSPRNIAVIAAYPSPRNIRQVRALLGTVGYYRSFVPGFSLVAKPLFNLLRKDAPWRWGKEEEGAFQTLKTALTSEPILRAPDFGRPFLVQTDFCKTAVAACLAQKGEDGREYAVQFASKKLTPAQTCWSSADGEAYAAVWAIKHFRPYLYGKKFTLITDSMAVRHLKTASAQDLHGKLARYALKLQQYDFDIQHRPGTAHGNVDGLSRLGHLVDEPDEESALMSWLNPLALLCDAAEAMEQEEEIEVFLSDGMTDAYRMAQAEPEVPIWFGVRERPTSNEGTATPGEDPTWRPVPPTQPYGQHLEPVSPTRVGVSRPASPPGGVAGVVRPRPPVQPALQGALGAAYRSRDQPASRAPLTDASPAYSATGARSKPVRRRLVFDDDEEDGAAAAPTQAAEEAITAAAPPAEAKKTRPEDPRKRQRTVRLQDYVDPARVETEDDEPEEKDPDPELRCVICNKGLPTSTMLLCDHPGCGTGWHMGCLDPPLKQVPKGRWYCPPHAAGGSAAPAPQRPKPSAFPHLASPTTSDETQPPSDSADPDVELIQDEVDEDAAPSEGEEPPTADKKQKQLPVWEDQGMLEYLLTGQFTHRPQQSGADFIREATRIRKRAAGYVLDDGQLFKVTADKVLRLRIPQPDERKGVIKEAHELGHFGVSKTYAFLRYRFWWEGMKEDVKAYIRECAQCTGNKLKLLKTGALRPLPIVPLWHRVHVDCMGPYKKTPRGNRYCILAVDSWSKYLEVGALPNRQSETVRTWFWENWVCRYGTPVEVLTDRGGEFGSALDNLLKEQRIRHLRTSGYRPQTNGQAERIVGALLESMRKTINARENDWDIQVHQAAYAYRATKQDSTGVSPAMCLFGRELTIAAERQPPTTEVVDVDSEVEEIEMTAEHYQGLARRQEAMERLAERVEANIIKAKERNEQQYNARQLRSKPRQVKGAGAARAATTPGDSARPLNSLADPPPASAGAAAPRPNEGPGAGLAPPGEVDPLAHLPDLPEDARVYLKKPRKTKTGSDREGPYFFDCWHPTGAYAQLKDRDGRKFSIAVHRLLVPPEFA